VLSSDLHRHGLFVEEADFNQEFLRLALMSIVIARKITANQQCE